MNGNAQPDCNSQFIVRQAEPESFEAALDLLSRFFQEEGFHTPPEALRANLLAMMSSTTSAVFLAWWDPKAVGVADGHNLRWPGIWVKRRDGGFICLTRRALQWDSRCINRRGYCLVQGSGCYRDF